MAQFLPMKHVSATMTHHHKLTEMYSLTVLEAGSLKSTCPQGHASLQTEGENLFLAFLLVSGVMAILAVPWFGTASLQSLPPSPQGRLSVFLCLPVAISPLCFSPLLIRILVILD